MSRPFYTRLNRIYKLTGIIVVTAFMSAAVSHTDVSAFSGTGYFTGRPTCTTDDTFSSCQTGASYNQNDVISGRNASNTNGFDALEPYARASKAGFLNWVDNQRRASEPFRDRQGARFIIETMTRGGNYAELVRRVNDPDVVMRTVRADPNNYGNGRISFSGRTNTGGRDIFFTNYDASPRELLIFHDRGNPFRIYYVLEIPCANPIGGLPGLPASSPWRVNGSTTKTRATAYPGQLVTFEYFLRNTTRYTMNRDTNWRAQYSVDGGGWTTFASGDRRPIAPNTTVRVDREDFTIPLNAPEGREYCRRITWAWTSSSDRTRSQSARDCVTVVYSYELQPIVEAPQTSMALGDSVDNVSMRVNNTGPTRSNTAAWGLVRFVVPSGTVYTTPGGTTALGNNSNFECQIATEYTAAPVNCTSLDNLPAGRIFDLGNTTTVPDEDDSLAGVPLNPGDRVCYAAMVNRYNESATTADWRYSDLDCVQVGKVPSVHIWGNDLRVGSSSTLAGAKLAGIQGRTVTTGGLTYGSWGEYSVIAPGSISGFSSASGLSGGNPSAVAADWNELTFANTPSFGSFAPTASLGLFPDIQSYVSRFDPADVDVRTTGALNGWPSSPRRHIVVEAPGSGRIQILGDIVAGFAYTNVESMPQLIIIADEIDIRDDVQRIDAWLVAQTISTCSNGPPGNLTVSDCSLPLTVNGPIIAEQLDLRRTAGSDSVATLNDPAETINMPASTYIWARHYDQKNGQLKTITTRELPPRY